MRQYFRESFKVHVHVKPFFEKFHFNEPEERDICRTENYPAIERENIAVYCIFIFLKTNEISL